MQCPAIATFSSYYFFAICTCGRESERRPLTGTTKRVSPLAMLIKYLETFDHVAPLFTEGQNAQKVWPKFRPQSPSDGHIFEQRQFMGKQKQTCQGSMIGPPPYQTRDRWVPPTLRTVGAMGTQKGKSGKFRIYPPFQRPTLSRRPPIPHQQWGPRLCS